MCLALAFAYALSRVVPYVLVSMSVGPDLVAYASTSGPCAIAGHYNAKEDDATVARTRVAVVKKWTERAFQLDKGEK